MVKRYRGGLMSATEIETTPANSSGMFNTSEAAQEKQAQTWPAPLGTTIQILTTTTPWIAGYTFSSLNGFGTKYANFAGAWTNGGGMGSVDYSPQGDVIVVTNTASQAGFRRIAAINWTGAGGYGTVYLNPAQIDSIISTRTLHKAKFSPQGRSIIWAHTNSSANVSFRAITWNSATGWGSVVGTERSGATTPSTISVNSSWGVFAKSSTYYYVVVSYSEDGGWGSLTGGFTSSSQYGLSSYSPVAFDGSPTGDTLVIGNSNTAPGIHAYPMSGTTPGTKYAAPGSAPTVGTPTSIKWSKNGDFVAVTGGSAPYLEIYKWNKAPLVAGWGTKMSSPVTIPAGSVTTVQWSPDFGSIIVLSPNLEAWSWSPVTGMGSKFSNPATSPGTSANLQMGMAVSPT